MFKVLFTICSIFILTTFSVASEYKIDAHTAEAYEKSMKSLKSTLPADRFKALQYATFIMSKEEAVKLFSMVLKGEMTAEDAAQKTVIIFHNKTVSQIISLSKTYKDSDIDFEEFDSLMKERESLKNDSLSKN